MSDSTASTSALTFGIDLGAKRSQVCVLRGGKFFREFDMESSPAAFRKEFAGFERGAVLMEVCGSSPWVSKLLTSMGYDVTVCQATALKETVRPRRKNDRDDARALAKLCAGHRDLLRPVQHRSEALQKVMRQLVIRRGHVECRTRLVNEARGLARSAGEKIEDCSPEAFPVAARKQLTVELAAELKVLLGSITLLTKAIRELDAGLRNVAKNYSEVALLTQVCGVGPLTSLMFLVVIQDPSRFPDSRTVGSYLGLTPRQYQSGDRDPQMRISKMGDSYLRHLLVQCAHYILAHKNADSDLRRFGLKLVEQGGAHARKRAIVAMARRLSVLLLSLWKSREAYEPLRNTRLREQQQVAAFVA